MAKITFIGGGNMASAIIGGLIADGMNPTEITVVEPNATQRAHLAETLGAVVTDDAKAACREAAIVVLAVKPQIVPAVAEQVTHLSGKLLISIAAGVTVETLEALFGDISIVRTMPNTPALLGLGATGLYANERTTQRELAEAEKIVNAFGISVTVEREELLDAVTAVSGSGPAYFFLLIEEMIRAGKALGLTEEEATALTLQTALGAASMAAKGDVEPQELRRRVTSPNGTTHAAIMAFQDSGFGDLVQAAVTAARDRAIELGKG
ncbi:MAG: pyrroline-5-carboxylate reductase [Paracoccaceae bacterium]|nr:pyrroline-5-carboxylate reductase [Paracoccaceae bacterium]